MIRPSFRAAMYVPWNIRLIPEPNEICTEPLLNSPSAITFPSNGRRTPSMRYGGFGPKSDSKGERRPSTPYTSEVLAAMNTVCFFRYRSTKNEPSIRCDQPTTSARSDSGSASGFSPRTVHAGNHLPRARPAPSSRRTAARTRPPSCPASVAGSRARGLRSATRTTRFDRTVPPVRAVAALAYEVGSGCPQQPSGLQSQVSFGDSSDPLTGAPPVHGPLSSAPQLVYVDSEQRCCMASEHPDTVLGPASQDPSLVPKCSTVLPW